MPECPNPYRGHRFPREVIAQAVRLYLRFGGRLHWLWRAVDEHGQTLDVVLQERRDTAAAERFFRRLLAVAAGGAPTRITTDWLGSYAAALVRLPELATAEHLPVRSAIRCNNRVEQAHQPTRIRERVMRRFQSATSTQRCLRAVLRWPRSAQKVWAPWGVRKPPDTFCSTFIMRRSRSVNDRVILALRSIR